MKYGIYLRLEAGRTDRIGITQDNMCLHRTVEGRQRVPRAIEIGTVLKVRNHLFYEVPNADKVFLCDTARFVNQKDHYQHRVHRCLEKR